LVAFFAELFMSIGVAMNRDSNNAYVRAIGFPSFLKIILLLKTKVDVFLVKGWYPMVAENPEDHTPKIFESLA